MILMIAALRPQIEKLCRRFHVRRLDVFGSAARETDFGDRSDIDLLVEYEPEHGSPDFGDYLELRDRLADLFGRKVDLVMAGPVRNPYIRASIERSRQTVHGS